MERKKAAEERRRLEEDKAMVRPLPVVHHISTDFYVTRWEHGKQQDYDGKLAEVRRSTVEC